MVAVTSDEDAVGASVSAAAIVTNAPTDLIRGLPVPEARRLPIASSSDARGRICAAQLRLVPFFPLITDPWQRFKVCVGNFRGDRALMRVAGGVTAAPVERFE